MPRQTSSSVDDVQTNRELNMILNRLEKLERTQKSDVERGRESDTTEKGLYRLVKEGGNYHVEFKFKDGWVRSSASTLTKRS